MGRRVMFLWTILNKPKSELVRQVYDSMCEFPSVDDWRTLVKSDLSFLDIHYSDEYISMTTKSEMKKLIRRSISVKRDEYLQNLQKSHTKSSYLKIGEKPQEYLISKRLPTPLKKFLFSLRNRMSPNKVNFKKKYSDWICRLCEAEESEESLLHFTSCDFLLQNVPEV